MILTQLPDLPPRPETAANAAFRRWFYARWGRENAIVCGSARHAEYAAIAQCLSVKLAHGAGERYLLPRRELLVDDDRWLVLNQGRCYGSRLADGPAGRGAAGAGAGGMAATRSFAVFFRPGLLDEVRAARRLTPVQLLEPSPTAAPAGFEFGEHLRPHGGEATQRLHGLQAAVQQGERSELWLEQQLLLLAGVLLQLEGEDDRLLARLPAARTVTRRELLRRLRRAADCLQTRYAEDLTLDDLAGAACLSRYHFVRCFGAVFGLSPYAGLMRKRAACARRLLAAGATDRDAVAQHCGLGTRWGLARALRRFPDAG